MCVNIDLSEFGPGEMVLSPFYRTVALVMAHVMFFSPVLANADPFKDAADEGRLFGDDLQGGFQMPSKTPSGFSFNYQNGTSDSVEGADLSPFTSGAIESETLTPTGVETDTTVFEGLAHNAGAMLSDGQATMTSLYADAELEDPSTLQGAAYKVVLGAADRQRPDLSGDPIFAPGSATMETLDNLDVIAEGFSDCSTAVNYSSTSSSMHIPDIQQCLTVVDRSNTCTVEHDYHVVPLVTHSSGEFGIADCGEGCAELSIGKIGDNYWSGSCEISEAYTVVRVTNPDAIQSATLNFVKWDDHIQVLAGPPGQEVLVWNGPYNYFPPEIPGTCELGQNWEAQPNVDLTSLFKGIPEGEELSFRIRVSIWGEGEGYGRIRLTYNKADVIKDEWGVINKINLPMPPLRVAAAEGENVTFDFDLIQGTGAFVDPTDHPVRTFEVPTVSYPDFCETETENTIKGEARLFSSTHWGQSVLGTPTQDTSASINVLQMPNCMNGLKGRVQITDYSAGTADNGEALGGEYNFGFTRYEIPPDSCLASLNSLYDGAAQGAVTCLEQPNTECITSNNETICSEDLSPPPMAGMEDAPQIPEISNICRLLELDANYDFYEGELECIVDARTGETVCPANEEGPKDTCQDLKDDPDCGYISQECVEGARGASGECYLFESRYDCGVAVEVESVEAEETYTCAGEIRCMGDECADNSKESSQDFVQAAALLNAAQFIRDDLECEDPTAGTGCKVFKGKGMECKIAVGGIQDCCDTPVEIGVGDYIKGLMALQRLDAGLTAIGANSASPLHGSAMVDGYVTARNAVVKTVSQSWEKLTSPLQSSATSVMDAIEPATNAIQSAADFAASMQDKAIELVDSFRQKIVEESSKLLSAAGESAAGAGGAAGGAANAAGEEAADVGAQSLLEAAVGSNAAAVMGTLMTAYTAVMVAYMAVQLIYACEEEELELNAKRELKSCSYLGSYCAQEVPVSPYGPMICIEKKRAYCCFNSPLSRIIQEQVIDQLGMTFGDKKNPICEGIPIHRMADIDWSLVNFDEWIALQVQHGVIPEVNGMTMDRLTGAGSAYNLNGYGAVVEDRKDATQRAQTAFDGTDPGATRLDTSNSMDPFTGAP